VCLGLNLTYLYTFPPINMPYRSKLVEKSPERTELPSRALPTRRSLFAGASGNSTTDPVVTDTTHAHEASWETPSIYYSWSRHRGLTVDYLTILLQRRKAISGQERLVRESTTGPAFIPFASFQFMSRPHVMLGSVTLSRYLA
jgi:hypothetical protein